jgi:hypothetical protein
MRFMVGAGDQQTHSDPYIKHQLGPMRFEASVSRYDLLFKIGGSQDLDRLDRRKEKTKYDFARLTGGRFENEFSTAAC